jgi:acetate kinase
MTNPEFRPPVLALNSGSSSLKFGLYRVGSSQIEMLLSGEAESIGDKEAKFHAHDSRGNRLLSDTRLIPSQREAIICIGRLLADFAQEHFPGLPQVACFDTTFHAELAEVARVLPISKDLQLEGIQRYGFHGLSCESIVRQLANDLPNRLVIAHLGNGASVTAVKGGKSIDTSMGLTPTGGVMMGTRSGDLDPGLLVYLMREKKFDAAMLEELVDHRSGLLGISGVTSDMRRLHEAASSNPDAGLAIQMFCYSVRKQVAAMIAALDGVDLIVFTGGIGEHDGDVRAAICGGLSWIGVSLDKARNWSATNPINDSLSRCSVLVFTSQEDEQIARHTWALFPQNLS